MSNTSRGDKSRVRISPSPFLRGVDATDNLGGVGALLSLRIITEGGNKTLYLTFVEPATARTAISRIHQREFPAIPSAASIQLLPAEGFDLIQLPTNRLTRRIKLAGGGLFRIISPQNFYTEARKFAGPDGIEDINQPSTGETVMTFASVYLANGYVDYLRTKKKHGLLQGVRVEFSFLKDKCGNLTNPQPWFKTF